MPITACEQEDHENPSSVHEARGRISCTVQEVSLDDHGDPFQLSGSMIHLIYIPLFPLWGPRAAYMVSLSFTESSDLCYEVKEADQVWCLHQFVPGPRLPSKLPWQRGQF